MRNIKYGFLLIGFLIAITIIAGSDPMVSAHGGDDNLVHICVGTGLLNNGLVNIVGSGTSCAGNETALDWNALGLPGTGGFVSNLENRNYDGIDMRYRNFKGADLSGSAFNGANFDGSDLSGGDFSDSDLGGNFISSTDITGTDFTNSTLNGAVVQDSAGQGANFTNSHLVGTDFTNTDLTGSTFTNAEWDNTTCPDETNSDNNGDTCVGHLSP